MAIRPPDEQKALAQQEADRVAEAGATPAAWQAFRNKYAPKAASRNLKATPKTWDWESLGPEAEERYERRRQKAEKTLIEVGEKNGIPSPDRPDRSDLAWLRH